MFKWADVSSCGTCRVSFYWIISLVTDSSNFFIYMFMKKIQSLCDCVILCLAHISFLNFTTFLCSLSHLLQWISLFTARLPHCAIEFSSLLFEIKSCIEWRQNRRKSVSDGVLIKARRENHGFLCSRMPAFWDFTPWSLSLLWLYSERSCPNLQLQTFLKWLSPFPCLCSPHDWWEFVMDALQIFLYLSCGQPRFH